MSHTPIHPDNPYRLPVEEQAPAKIWELLRRNRRFVRAVEWLRTLDERNAKASLDGVSAPAFWPRSFRFLKGVEARHAFAGCALQWLVPEPLFVIEKVAVPPAEEIDAEGWFTPKVVSRGIGTSPDQNDRQSWHWTAGELEGDAVPTPHRRGPWIHYVTSDEPSLQDKVNPIQEWKDYFANGRCFTVEDGWRDAPPGFKRRFQFLWRQLDSRRNNPITGNRTDAPVLHEVAFFREYDLGRAMQAAAAKKALQGTDLQMLLEFDTLAHRCRLESAVPSAGGCGPALGQLSSGATAGSRTDGTRD